MRRCFENPLGHFCESLITVVVLTLFFNVLIYQIGYVKVTFYIYKHYYSSYQ
jgi:hypothetical protein